MKSERLKRIAARIDVRLEREHVLAYAGLQYMACEVGSPFQRLDPRELAAALKLWTTTEGRRLETLHGASEPRPNIFVTRNIARQHVRHATELAAATKEDQLQALVEACPHDRAATIADVLTRRMPGGTHHIEKIDEKALEHVGGDVRWVASGILVRTSQTSIWVTDNLGWLFPDDPGLWRHLVRCLGEKRRPIVVARKIAFSTFPLLKRLGALGLQLHHVYVPGGLPPLPLPERALVPGPLVLDTDRLDEHPVILDYLPSALASPNLPVDPISVEALALAADLALHTESDHALATLREWTRSTPVVMPTPWKAQLTRYSRWLDPLSVDDEAEN